MDVSPCFEFDLTDLLIRKKNMTCLRNYFSLVCLTKKQKNMQSDYFLENSDKNINIADGYSCETKQKYLYGIGGKGFFIVTKSIEKYDILRDEWLKVKT